MNQPSEIILARLETKLDLILTILQQNITCSLESKKLQVDTAAKLDYVLNTSEVTINTTPVAPSQQTTTTSSVIGGQAIVTVVPKNTKKSTTYSAAKRFKDVYKISTLNKNCEEYKLINSLLPEDKLAEFKKVNAAAIEANRGCDKVDVTAAFIWRIFNKAQKADITKRIAEIDAKRTAAVAAPLIAPNAATAASTSSITTAIATNTSTQ